MKNRKLKFGICFSLISILTVGAACFISSDPSEEYFGDQEVDTTNDLKVVISPTSNPLGEITYPYYFPIKLEKGWPINLKGREISPGADPKKHIFQFDYSNKNQFFGNMKDADQYYTNENKIDGITSITVDFDYEHNLSEKNQSDVRLSTWFEGDERIADRANVQILKPGVPATFTNYQPCYFSLDTIGKPGFQLSVVNVKSITITYTCKKTVSPYIPNDAFKFEFDDINKTATVAGINKDLKGYDLIIPEKVHKEGDFNTFYNVTKIGDYAFDNFESLNKIELPNTIKEIGNYAFRNVTFQTINMPQSLTYIGDYAFSKSRLPSIDLSNVTHIGERAFYGCSCLIDINISNVKELGTYAFAESAVSTVKYSNYLNYVPTGTFSKAQVKSINLSDKIIDIQDYAFDNCNLSEFTMPGKLESIGQYAFRNTYGLNVVNLPNTIKKVGTLAFTYEMYVSTINVPFAKDKLPEGFAPDWVDSEVIVNYAA